MNWPEAEQVVALARQKKLFLMEAMWTRFMPALAEVRRIIASGEIGPVHHLTADLGFAATQGPEHRIFNPSLGGGGRSDCLMRRTQWPSDVRNCTKKILHQIIIVVYTIGGTS